MLARRLHAAAETKAPLLSLESHAKQSAAAAVAAATRARSTQHTKRRPEPCAAQAGGFLSFQHLPARFTRERVCEADAMRKRRHRAAVIVALEAELLANRADLVRKIMQPLLQ